MEALSVMASLVALAQLAASAAKTLHDAVKAFRDIDCDALGAELNMLQEVLSHLDLGSSPVEKLPQTYPMALSEVIKDSTETLEELLSVLERAQRPTRYPYKRLAHIGLPKTLESTRDKIRHQIQNFRPFLSLRNAELNCRVDADIAKYKEKLEELSIGFILPEGANLGDIHQHRPEAAERTLKMVATIAAHSDSGRGKDLNDVRMIILSRCLEGGLVVVGAAGAAMTGCWAQTRNNDAWMLGSAVDASKLDLDSVQAASVHGYRITEILSLQTLIPKAVFDSPTTLVTSIAITTLAMTAYHYRHRHEKYQDPLIFAIAGGGALAGRLAGLDGTGVLLRVIPWCVLFSLLLSAAWSQGLSRKPHPQIDHGAVSLKAGALDAM